MARRSKAQEAASQERGAALLSVLLLVAVMSVVAVAMLDDIRFTMRRTANAETAGQARWFAMGAEALALDRLAAIARLPAAGGASMDQPLAVPVQNGEVTARLSDAGRCFNLNSLVLGEADAPIQNAAGIRQFTALLEATGSSAPEALRLSGAVADWIDANNEVSRFGAEDAVYAARTPAYRTAGTLLAEESELRAVLGFTVEIYARVRPFVCALPMTGPSLININALKPDDAPVLSAVFEGRLSVAAAREAIAGRPERGFADIQDLLARPLVSAAAEELDTPPIDQLSTRSRFFALETLATYAGAEAVLGSLLEVVPEGGVRVVARRWTQAE